MSSERLSHAMRGEEFTQRAVGEGDGPGDTQETHTHTLGMCEVRGSSHSQNAHTHAQQEEVTQQQPIKWKVHFSVYFPLPSGFPVNNVIFRCAVRRAGEDEP